MGACCGQLRERVHPLQHLRWTSANAPSKLVALLVGDLELQPSIQRRVFLFLITGHIRKARGTSICSRFRGVRKLPSTGRSCLPLRGCKPDRVPRELAET